MCHTPARHRHHTAVGVQQVQRLIPAGRLLHTHKSQPEEPFPDMVSFPEDRLIRLDSLDFTLLTALRYFPIRPHRELKEPFPDMVSLPEDMIDLA